MDWSHLKLAKLVHCFMFYNMNFPSKKLPINLRKTALDLKSIVIGWLLLDWPIAALVIPHTSGMFVVFKNGGSGKTSQQNTLVINFISLQSWSRLCNDTRQKILIPFQNGAIRLGKDNGCRYWSASRRSWCSGGYVWSLGDGKLQHAFELSSYLLFRFWIQKP